MTELTTHLIGIDNLEARAYNYIRSHNTKYLIDAKYLLAREISSGLSFVLLALDLKYKNKKRLNNNIKQINKTRGHLEVHYNGKNTNTFIIHITYAHIYI